MSSSHHEMGPSRANALWQCPCFLGHDEETPAMARGTVMHSAIGRVLSRLPGDWGEYQPTAEDVEAVQWGAQQVGSFCSSMPQGTLHIEHQLDYPGEDDDLPPITAGTLDYLIVCPRDMMVVDIKTGQPRDHSPQMKLYALMAMHHYDRRECETALVYVDHRLVHRARYTWDECEDFLNALIDRIDGGRPTPCQYCSWCERQPDCPALLTRVEAIAHAQSWELADYTPGAMAGARELGRAYDLACQMEKWAEAVKAFVSKAAKSGESVDGYRVVTRAGAARVRDIQAAYHASGLPAEIFLECCSVRLGALKDAFVAANAGRLDTETGKKATKKALSGPIFDAAMGACIEEGSPVQMLVRCKTGKRTEIIDDCVEDGETG